MGVFVDLLPSLAIRSVLCPCLTVAVEGILCLPTFGGIYDKSGGGVRFLVTIGASCRATTQRSTSRVLSPSSSRRSTIPRFHS
eukprot:1365270-Amorphochlora_amoeboformis.AAC.1